MNTPLSIETLEKNEYRKFIDQFKICKETSSSTKELSPDDPYKGTWQKCFRDELGKKYFINVEVWDFQNSVFNNRIQAKEISFSANSQMETYSKQTFNCQLLSIKTLEDLENFFETQWTSNVCKYYELFEDEEEIA